MRQVNITFFPFFSFRRIDIRLFFAIIKTDKFDTLVRFQRKAMEMSQKKPVFQEVAGSLSTRIRRRELTPGMALPSENELCRQFSISRFSVRKALDILEADGLIFRQPGVGSFVSESRRPQKEQKTLNIAITGSSSGFNPYIAEVFDGAQKICSGENARLVYCPTEEFIARNGGDMDGLILMTTRETPDDFRRLNAISGSGIPVVLINRFSDLPNLAYATVDYELESRRAVELLFRMGRKRVGLIQTASLNSYANQTRTAGYREACRQAGRLPWTGRSFPLRWSGSFTPIRASSWCATR